MSSNSSINDKDIYDLYHCRIVKLQCFSKEKNSPRNEITYYLLVDDDNFILDYKIKFKQIHIRPETTPSHEKVKQNNYEFWVRKKLIEILGLEHKFSQNKNPKSFTDKTKINKVNDWFESIDLHDITFQNIEYILNGYNPGGQGNGIGYLNIDYKGKTTPFGLFIKSLNISKKAFKKFGNSIKKLWKSPNLETIDFLHWIESDKILYKAFNDFYNFPNEWKKIREKLENHFKSKFKDYETTENKILNLRNIQKKNINKKYNSIEKNINSWIYEQYFNINSSQMSMFEYAHIKPVWLIKKEYKNKKNEEILEQISDPYNFLPLSPNMHADFDRKKFYWNYKTGKMIILDENNLNKNEIAEFRQISTEVIKNIKYYLKEYEIKVIGETKNNLVNN